MSTPTATDIRLDDLAAPVLPPAFTSLQRKMDYFATALPPLEPGALLETAVQATGGLTDFGDPWFYEPFRALCASLTEDVELNPFGRVSQVQLLLRLLTVRLGVADLLNRYPEIRRVPVDRPVVIAGLPRTGTTFLHGLVAADPRFTHVGEREALDPLDTADAGGDGDGAHDADRLQAVVDLAVPHLRRMHEVLPGGPQEDIVPLAYSFGSGFFETQAALPQYRDWYEATDQTPAYEYLRTLLQVIRWRRGGGRWVLKAPQHAEHLAALSTVFPDATVVLAHRDPVPVTASTATMMAYFARLNTTGVDPVAIGRYWAGRIATIARRCAEQRETVPAARSLDVHLGEIRDDHGGVLDRVYRLAGLDRDAAARAAARRYTAERHPHRHGRVRYDLAAVGLDAAGIRAATTGYTGRFAPPREHP